MAAPRSNETKRTLLLVVALALASFVAIRCGESGGAPGAGGLCQGVICEDGRECTRDVCDLETGYCHFTPVENGTLCSLGICVNEVCEQIGSVLPCTEAGIRAAIETGGGPFTFSCDEPTTVTTREEIIIDNDVILDGEGYLTVDGNDDHRVFQLVSGVVVELHGFTIAGGKPHGDPYHLSIAGGIWNEGGELTLTHSTISGNEAGVGGGLVNAIGATMSLTNCTVSGNSANVGGGLFNVGNLTMTNTTVADNSAKQGSAISFGATTSLSGTILEGDCDGDPALFLTSDGYNIESPRDSCGFMLPTDQYDVSAQYLDLGPLADNGGQTKTHAPGPSSVALDVIPEESCLPPTDQRGVPRPQGERCDVGAVEVVSEPTPEML